MSSSGAADDEASVRITSVLLGSERLTIRLADGRELGVPLWWYPRLLAASPEQRGNWRLSANGRGIHWPDVDEDLSAKGLLADVRAHDAVPPRGATGS